MLAACALSACALAHAAPPALRLSVVRSPDATDCPDEPALASMVAALSRSPGPPSPVLVDVQFLRDRDGYQVHLSVSGPQQGQRTLTDPGPRCASLAEATALTIAMLLDPSSSRPPPSASAPSASSPPSASSAPPPASSPSTPALASSAPPPPPPPSTPQPSRALPSLVIGASGLLTTGITATPAAGVGGEAALRWRSGLHLGLGAVWLPARTFELSPGSVEVELLAALARGCWRLPAGPLQAGGCALVGVGRYRAQASGFSRNEAPSSTWLGVGAGALLGGDIAGPVGWELSAAWVASPVHEAFVIERLGPAFEPKLTGGLWASLSLQARVW